MGLLHHQFIVLWQLMSVWRNNFSGPGTVILKVSFLCINSTRKPLLIHGFSPLNARLLTVYSTAFYAIIRVKKVFLFFFQSVFVTVSKTYGCRSSLVFSILHIIISGILSPVSS